MVVRTNHLLGILIGFLLSLTMNSSVSWAGGLATPWSVGSTAVLPKGVRSLRIGGMMTSVEGWYNDSGVTTGVAEPFNQNLSYARLLKAEKNENLKLNVESQLRNKNVDLNSMAGQSYADINTIAIVTLPAIAYGLTDRWMIAAAVPIVYTNMDVATGFVGTPQLQKLVTDFSQKSRKQTALIQNKLTDVIATEISNKGYAPLADQEKTQVGDVVLMAKYLAYQSLSYSWAITNTFTFPTAHVRDVNKVVDPTPGDGQFDYGITSTFEVPVSGQMKLVNQTSYTIQFSDVRETRIPVSKSERLSSDIDHGAKRDIGDIVTTSLGAMYSPWSVLTLGGSYTLGYKERDKWSGGNFSSDRYEVLGVETEQFMQAAYLEMSLSTVNLYKERSFPIPFMAGLGVGKVIDGRNVRHDPLWNLNMTVFF